MVGRFDTVDLGRHVTERRFREPFIERAFEIVRALWQSNTSSSRRGVSWTSNQANAKSGVISLQGKGRGARPRIS